MSGLPTLPTLCNYGKTKLSGQEFLHYLFFMIMILPFKTKSFNFTILSLTDSGTKEIHRPTSAIHS